MLVYSVWLKRSITDFGCSMFSRFPLIYVHNVIVQNSPLRQCWWWCQLISLGAISVFQYYLTNCSVVINLNSSRQSSLWWIGNNKALQDVNNKAPKDESIHCLSLRYICSAVLTKLLHTTGHTLLIISLRTIDLSELLTLFLVTLVNHCRPEWFTE